MEVRRGDIVVASGPGDFARKPRPFLVVQSDAFNATHASYSLCPITSAISGDDLFRVGLASSPETGLRERSEVQIDKVQSLRRERVEAVIGAAPAETLDRIDDALRRWFDL